MMKDNLMEKTRVLMHCFQAVLRTDTTRDAEKQIWHIYAHRTVKMLLLSRKLKITSLYHITWDTI